MEGKLSGIQTHRKTYKCIERKEGAGNWAGE